VLCKYCLVFGEIVGAAIQNMKKSPLIIGLTLQRIKFLDQNLLKRGHIGNANSRIIRNLRLYNKYKFKFESEVLEVQMRMSIKIMEWWS